MNQLTVNKPTVIIFLDVEGVLLGSARMFAPLWDKIYDKATELFGKRERDGRFFSCLEWEIAASHFYNKNALENLDELIERISKVYNVSIVISAHCRNEGSKDVLKNQVFAVCKFSKFIIDKTTDDDIEYSNRYEKRKKEWFKTKTEDEENEQWDKYEDMLEDKRRKGLLDPNDESIYRKGLSPVALEKYGFELKSKAAQIDYWLRENHSKLNLGSFVMISGYDDEVSERFPQNFVHVDCRELLKKPDIEKAENILNNVKFTPPQSTQSAHREGK